MTNIIDYTLSLKDRMKETDEKEYDQAAFELNAVFNKVLAGAYGVRTAVIFCYLFPEYIPAFAESMLDTATFLNESYDEDDDGYKYLQVFLRLFQEKIESRYVSRAIDRISIKNYGMKNPEYGKPGDLYLAFATLSPKHQDVVAPKVAQYLFYMGNEYYLAKFFYYYRRIRQKHELDRHFFFSYNLSEEWLDRWLDNQIKEGREKLRLYKKEAEKAGVPLSSPDSAIIKGRYGVTSPQFIVMHSAGAGSPVERIVANFFNPNSKVTAHFVVTVKGRIYQLTSLDDAAKANRTDNDPDEDRYYKLSRHDFFRQTSNNANNFTVAIECEEFGDHGRLAPCQYFAVLHLFKYINEKLGIPIDDWHVIGHGDVTPITKSYCPGESFPLKSLIEDYQINKNNLGPAVILDPAELV